MGVEAVSLVHAHHVRNRGQRRRNSKADRDRVSAGGGLASPGLFRPGGPYSLDGHFHDSTPASPHRRSHLCLRGFIPASPATRTTHRRKSDLNCPHKQRPGVRPVRDLRLPVLPEDRGHDDVRRPHDRARGRVRALRRYTWGWSLQVRACACYIDAEEIRQPRVDVEARRQVLQRPHASEPVATSPLVKRSADEGQALVRSCRLIGARSGCSVFPAGIREQDQAVNSGRPVRSHSVTYC